MVTVGGETRTEEHSLVGLFSMEVETYMFDMVWRFDIFDIDLSI